jgi:hypothetical protein
VVAEPMPQVAETRAGDNVMSSVNME